MRYRRVCIESLGYFLPHEVVTSDEIEARLGPLYERLRLPAGRLELMTGIRERRFWRPDMLPSEASIRSGRLSMAAAGVLVSEIGALVHGSVCRDHLEPATASTVHQGLGLGRNCLIYDVSNACLGLLNGMIQVANMIELGQIRAGLIVGSEGSRQLVEATIESLNSNQNLTRRDIKLAVASLTIGSASVALLLTDLEISQTQNRLLGVTSRSFTEHHRLCRSGRDEAVAEGMKPLMTTDSEALMRAGVEAGRATFGPFLEELGWRVGDIGHTVCHQVGSTHRNWMLSELGLLSERDYTSFDYLGNTGSAALPVTLALAAEQGRLSPGGRLALLGIGSGVNVVMAGVEWRESRVRGETCS